MRKILSIALVLVIAFTVSAPRAAATGIGAGLSVAEMAGVIAVIAASLGVTFLDGSDMQRACNAFVGDVVPGTPMDVFLRACGVSDGYIYLPGEIAKTEMMAVIAGVRSFFVPGSDIVDSPSSTGSVVIDNLGQIWTSSGIPSADSGVAFFDVTDTPVVFYSDSGEAGSVSLSFSLNSNNTFIYHDYVCTVDLPNGVTKTDSALISSYKQYGAPFCFFSNEWNGNITLNYCYYDANGNRSIMRQYSTGIKFSALTGVSGGGPQPDYIPVFQEAGALSPDLVGGVWDQLANDAADQNGNVIIDTNTPSFQGGSAGLIPGVPDNNLVNPQQGALGSIGSTKTETDTSTGTQTQTQTQTGTQAVPQSQTANPAISEVQAQTSFNGVALTLTEIFPFCIPFDIYFMLQGLSVARQAPSFEIPLHLGSFVNFSHTFDFEQFDQYAQVLRSGELAVFVIGLAAATRKFIKW